MEWLKQIAPTVLTLLTGGAGTGLVGLAVEAVEGALGMSGGTKESVTEALQSGRLNSEQIAALKIAENNLILRCKELDIDIEKARIDAAKSAQVQVTERWKADMMSDSWLSKNIRPLVLMYLLFAYSAFSLMSAANINVTQAYVELLAQMLMLVTGAYFAGRSTEKIVEMTQQKHVQPAAQK